jgi:arabinofuranosyltransferase
MRLGRLDLREIVVAILAVAIVTWEILLVGDWRVDDAYISFAFAKNLAHGNGLIFSHDVRVEGYTNFLWTVVNALPIALFPNSDPLVAARVLCFASFAGLLVATWLIARLFAGRLAAACAVLLLAAWTDLTRASLSGLETMPHAMLLAFGTYHYLVELRSERKYSLWWFAFAALTRISGMLGLAFVIGFEVLLRAFDRKLDWRGLLRWALGPVVLFAAYFAWRFWYYGLPLPTTYYAKTLVAALDPDRGARYLWDAARDLGIVPVGIVVVIGLVRRFERRTVYLAAAIAFELVYVLRVGADWMPFSRFLIPIAPLAVALFASGLSELRRASREASFGARASATIACCASVAWVAVHLDSHLVMTPQAQFKLDRAAHEKLHTYQNLYVNRNFFAAITRKPGDVLATDYGGIFGYYTDASLIEMWGLCNRDIALRGNTEGINPIYGKTCIECYRVFDPDYFHVMTPIVRGPNDFPDQRAVISQVFQGWALNRVIDLFNRYATGRVLEPSTGRALWFLEKRKPQNKLVPRTRSDGFVIDYPFEPGGRSPAVDVRVARP